MLSRVSDNPQNCRITNIQIILNLLDHEPSCQTVGCILVKRGPIASEIAVTPRQFQYVRRSRSRVQQNSTAALSAGVHNRD
jgi:hypothetical protein